MAIARVREVGAFWIAVGFSRVNSFSNFSSLFSLTVPVAGLSSYFQLRGRDCNLVYAAKDGQGQPSQAFRTLVLQEFLARGILAPSFVVGAAHDPAAIQQTIDAVAELMPVYQRALEDGVETVLRGRPVRPTIRRRG